MLFFSHMIWPRKEMSSMRYDTSSLPGALHLGANRINMDLIFPQSPSRQIWAPLCWDWTHDWWFGMWSQSCQRPDRGWELCLFWFLSQTCWAGLQNVLLVCKLRFRVLPLASSPLSQYKGQTGYSIVLRCKSSLCYGQLSFVCVFRGFSCRLCFLWQLCFTDWKAPDYNQLCRGTPGSFVDDGWWIISIPLEKLLIEGVMSLAAPPRLAVTDARATHQLKAACVAQIAVFVTSGSVVCSLWWLCLLWLRISTRLCYSRPWPLQGVQMSRKRSPGRRLRSCQLSQSIWRHRKKKNLYLITF